MLALGIGLASLALCPPVGVVALVLGVTALRRADALPGRPGRRAAVAAITTGVVSLLMTLALVWFWFAMVTPSTTTIDDVDTLPADGTCDAARFLSDPDC